MSCIKNVRKGRRNYWVSQKINVLSTNVDIMTQIKIQALEKNGSNNKDIIWNTQCSLSFSLCLLTSSSTNANHNVLYSNLTSWCFQARVFHLVYSANIFICHHIVDSLTVVDYVYDSLMTIKWNPPMVKYCSFNL